MKRILIPAGGALLATGMLAAGLAGTASADTDVSTKNMAGTVSLAKEVASFWFSNNGAALRAAKESNVWDTTDVDKLQSKGGYNADTKPGVVAPIGGESKSTAKAQNVNIPKTLGKVFFVNDKGEKRWCSATSIQSNYRNLVATAGHCVYNPDTNADLMDKWVFVPGYYQGKAPFGIYVGKQAFTHYDFNVYEDYDRDYAFVTVYNGVEFNGSGPSAKDVSKAEYDAYKGPKKLKLQPVSKDEYDAGVAKYGEEGPYTTETGKADISNVGDDYRAKPGEHKILGGREVTEYDWNKAARDSNRENNGEQCGPWDCKVDVATGEQIHGSGQKFSITENEYKELTAAKAAGKFLGKLEKSADGNYFKTQYWVKQWFVVKDAETKFYKVVGYTILNGPSLTLKDVGRLGDKVGGQGVAWNQPTGKDVRVFGYPAAAHPDGNKAFTGITPKWCYGKTTAKTVGSAKKKIDEHVGLKCSMTEGADGGPWLYKYSNTKRLGYVNGVTSTFNDQDDNDRVDMISSPVFDGETKTVYEAAAKSWSGKILGVTESK